MSGRSLAKYPVHLGLGAKAVAQPEFNGMAWYEAYGLRHAADGAEGRLVSMHSSTKHGTAGKCTPMATSWSSAYAGAITLHQEHADGSRDTVTLDAGRIRDQSARHAGTPPM